MDLFFLPLLLLSTFTLICFLFSFQQLPSLLVPIQIKSDSSSSGSPIVPLTVSQLVKELQTAYQTVTSGKFVEALVIFKNILYTSIFVVAGSKAEMSELQQLVDICQDYILGLKMEIARKELPKESEARGAELAAYFTHCNLQPIHLMLTLRSAMNLHYKLENYRTASSFARRLLELGPKDDIAQKVCFSFFLFCIFVFFLPLLSPSSSSYSFFIGESCAGKERQDAHRQGQAGLQRTQPI